MADRVNAVDELGKKLAAAFSEAALVEALRARRMRRRRVTLTATVGCAVIIAVAVGLFGLNEGPSRRFLTVDDAVAAVARATYDQPEIPRARYLYVRTRTQNLGGGRTRASGHKTIAFHSVSTFEQEFWTKTGAATQRRITFYPAHYISARDKAMHDSLGPDPFNSETHVGVCRASKGIGRSPIDAPMVDFPPKRKLPTDPRRMHQVLAKFFQRKARGGVPADDLIWSAIQSMMMFGAPQLDAAQRAAMVMSISYLPGVELLPGTEDPNGRDAIGFARDNADAHSVVYFDRKTSLTTYVRIVTLRATSSLGSPIAAGTVIWSYSLEAFRFIDAPPKLRMTKKRSLIAPHC